MNIRRKGKPFFSSMLLGILAGFPGISAADDTEIYLGSDALLGNQRLVRPNVLFLLDTSGSMSSFVSGTGMDRLDNMKLALNTILDQSNNINVGLMRFTDPGGPILFPVSNINADVRDIEGGNDSPGGADIFKPVAPASADDASQVISAPNLNDGPVYLGEPLIAFGQSLAVNNQTTVVVRTEDNNDTAEERVSDGANITGTWMQFQPNQIDGIRFQDVEVPPGATILSARMFGNAPVNFTNNNALTIHFRGEANGDADAYSFGTNQVSSRPRTVASVDWVNPEPFFADVTYPNNDPALDLAPIVQEIVCQGQSVSPVCPGPNPLGGDGQPWDDGNAMAFIVEATSPSNNARSFRTQLGAGSTEYRKTRLEITYDVNQPAGVNLNGLRFTDISIPQGATVTSARIEFVAAEDSGSDSTPPVFAIRGHTYDDAPSFSALTPKIGGRPATTAEVVWQGTDLPPWTAESAYRTPDIAPIVQEIVNQPGWCGNNAMSFEIESIAGDPNARVAYSSENNQGMAPVLIIDIDENSIPAGGGCINQVFSSQVVDSDDDAEEFTSFGGISLGSSDLNMQSSQLNGFRFRDINIPQGATVLEADITFTSADIDTNPSTITFFGEDTDDADRFTSSSQNISSRPRTSAQVAWSAPPFENLSQPFVTNDLSPIVQEIVNRGGWRRGNDMVIMQTASGDDREAKSFNNSPAEAPVLRIKVQYGGAVIPPVIKTVRERLKEIVDGLGHQGFTPLVGQLYEAARYYRGEGVFHGRQRSHDFFGRANSRLSHPASYTGGTLVREAGCTDDNLSDPACFSERIDGNATYISPMEVGCQASYIIMLTDGEANHNANENGVDHGRGEVESLVGAGNCTGTTGERCGRALAEFLANEDQRGDLSGPQTVKTYTIGFNFSGQFLQDVADRGDGRFYTATNAADLADVFQQILVDILSRPTSFATPSLSVNAFNKLFNRNEVYFSLFEPSSATRWPGNVKKYNVCDLIEFTGCTLGEILDASGTSAIGVDSRIRDSATSVWSNSTDGIEVTEGGAADEVPFSASRRVYTYTGADEPSDEAITTAANRVEDVNSDLTKTLLGDPLMPDEERTNLINWIRGQDVDDEDGDGNFAEDRFKFEDPLHASPVSVAYGGSDAAPIDKLFAPTNGGGLRFINAETGEEEWVFFPQETLALQPLLRENPDGPHAYGLDLTPSIWTQDNNNNGIINASDGDFVRAFQGMRRGGNNYYAIDATPDSGSVSSPTATGEVSPRYMYRITGGSADFPFLGQTWSRPNVTRVRMGRGNQNEAVPVLIFGAGHDPSLDKEFNTSTQGNGVFIVDAETGDPIASIGGPGSGAGLEVPGMQYPVPADLSLLDSNGDGSTDRLYFGDLGGNVWRIDLNNELEPGATGSDIGIVGKLGDVSLSAGVVPGLHMEESRKFYSAPDVVQVVDALFNDEARYDLVLITSGNRPDPLNEIVRNSLFAFRDVAVTGLKDDDNNGIVDADDPDFQTITRSDMFDVTDNPFQTTLDGSFADPATALSALPDMQASSGWFIELRESNGDWIGEKGLSKPITLAGKLFFTTYIPVVDDNLAATCQLSEGSGRLYGLSVLNGAALFTDWNNGGGVNPNTADRYQELGGGIPSDAVPIFQKEGVTIIVGTGGGGVVADPGIALPRVRTYWFQE